MFKLKIAGKTKILKYAKRYNEANDRVVAEMVSKVREQGYLTKRQVRDVARWKSPRRTGLVGENASADVKSRTERAFASDDAHEKIRILTELRGIGPATASAILHWFDKKRYPIWDFRALWSCSADSLPFTHWEKYTAFCRKVADKHRVDMRTLDRALWQYSKDNQSPKSQR